MRITVRRSASFAALLWALASQGAAQDIACPCDCDGNGMVTIGEVIAAVNVALGRGPLTGCPSADSNGDGRVSVDELVAGVQAALGGCAATVTPTPSQIATPTPTPQDEGPPTDAAELLAWLRAGRYLGWRAESVVHPSGGPHFGRVRTFVNEALFASLQSANEEHPQGAAAVKELYGGSGDEVQGWSVSVKIRAESDGGRGWYWHEYYRGTVYGNGVGVPGCIGCHGGDYRTFISKDLILAPFPLQ